MTPAVTPQPQQLSVADFAAKVKAKYPAYAKVPDQELVERVVKKYPQYKAQVVTVGGEVAPGVPKPKVDMKTSAIGSLADKSLTEAGKAAYDIRKKSGKLGEGNVGSFEGSYSSGDTGKAAAMTAAGVTGATTLAGVGAAPKAVALWNAMPPYMKYAIGTYLLNQLDAGHKVKELGKLVGHVAGQ